MPKNIPSNQVTSNAQDIGYVLGKMEMIEKKFDEHRLETKQEKEEILDKLEGLAQTLSFWRHTLWLIKAMIASVPLVLAANYQELVQTWKEF